MSRSNRLHTIYHVLESRGFFDENPANIFARDADGVALYKGPQAYPRMLYSPNGEFRVVVPAEEVASPFGPKRVGEKREIVWKIVQNAEEESASLAAGWHKHPSLAIAAGGGEPAPVPEGVQLEQARMALAKAEEEKAGLAEQMKEMLARLAALEAAPSPTPALALGRKG